MAIADLSTYKALVKDPSQRINVSQTQFSGTNSAVIRYISLWKATSSSLGTGATPTSSVVPASTDSGTFAQTDGASNPLRIVGAAGSLTSLVSSGGTSGTLIVCDRLNHSGGLSGTTTGAQTTGLPTAALTRYTDGIGVFIGIELYSAVGSTATTITANYTNTAAASKDTPTVVFGGSNDREGARFFMLPLAAGDVGATAVANVTLAASTTTVGNFGVTMFKPLFALPIVGGFSQGVLGFHTAFDAIISGANLAPEIVDGAALWCLWYPRDASITHSMQTQFYLAEG